MYMQNNRVRWDDIVDIDINGMDPNPIPFEIERSGTNGFSHEEEIGFPDADKPTINNWIQTAFPFDGKWSQERRPTDCKATVSYPLVWIV